VCSTSGWRTSSRGLRGNGTRCERQSHEQGDSGPQTQVQAQHGRLLSLAELVSAHDPAREPN